MAADALGDVVYLELPAEGASVVAGAVVGEIESTKSVSDLYSPVTGEVIEINDAVVDDPTLVNSDAYGAGWLIKATFGMPACCSDCSSSTAPGSRGCCSAAGWGSMTSAFRNGAFILLRPLCRTDTRSLCRTDLGQTPGPRPGWRHR